jgi:hypothetical protein
MSINTTNKSEFGVFFYLFYVSTSLVVFLIYEFGGDKSSYGRAKNAVISADTRFHVNRNILQFSTFVLLNKYFTSDILVVEYLALFNKTYESHQAIQDHVKCLVRNKPTNETYIAEISKIVAIELKPVRNQTRFLWKVQCDVRIDHNLFAHLSLEMALVDTDDYNLNQNAPNKPDTNSISFQIPRVFNFRKPKMAKIANCVHMLKNLNHHRLRRLFDWILIQKRMGRLFG